MSIDGLVGGSVVFVGSVGSVVGGGSIGSGSSIIMSDRCTSHNVLRAGSPPALPGGILGYIPEDIMFIYAGYFQ